MMQQLAPLPVSEPNFANLRHDGNLYIDKTGLLLKLIREGRWYFLARPRRFGKSLTVSTPEAMFKGETDLFSGLEAEAWVAEQAKHPAPVVHLDLSLWDTTGSPEMLNAWLIEELLALAEHYSLSLSAKSTSAQTFSFLLRKLCQAHGQVAVFIDEYDAPILAQLDNPSKIDRFRTALREFYKILKGSASLIRFVFLTGISKFTKTGIFSALNNLDDISMNTEFGAIMGYTERELQYYFNDYIKQSARYLNYDNEDKLIQDIKNYYDGYSFDGQSRIYNPYSIVNFFKNTKFKNYWYESGATSSIANYFKKCNIENPDVYRKCIVSPDFLSTYEIEKTTVESFLFQAGYLTLAKVEDNKIVLDYPNREIINSMAHMFMSHIYKIPKYTDLAEAIRKAIAECNIDKVIEHYNTELAAIPYADFQNTGEDLYRAAFLLLLRSASLNVYSEVPTKNGRSDLIIKMPEAIFILEFNVVRNKNELPKKIQAGIKQFQAKNYKTPYTHAKRKIFSYLVIIDAIEHVAKAYAIDKALEEKKRNQ
ncbi:MAG: ATP-binding protein [Desulfovibrio sp.]|nr:ATP-binding protein [Desulfovibrio sp.]